jgi:hypothetical protein
MKAPVVVVAMAGWVALAVGDAGAAPFTEHFAALRASLEARRDSLNGASDADSAKRRAACVKSLGLLVGFSDSASTDLKTSGKVAKALEKAFPADDPLLVDLDGVLDGLEGEIAAPRAILVTEISLLAGARQSKASKGLGLSDVLADKADLAPTRALRAKYLGKALKKVLATRRALRGGGTPGSQGPRNPSFEDSDPFAVFPDPDGVLIRNSSNAIVGYLDQWRTAGGAGAKSGAGAPHGVTKGGVGAAYSTNTGYHPGTLFQDGVNLSRSRVLRFEWELTGNIKSKCSTTGEFVRARLDLKFVALSGTTITLWSTEQAPTNEVTGSFNVATTSEVVELPFIPEPGTLGFFADVAVPPCPPPPPPPPGTPPGTNPTNAVGSWSYFMYVDNIRVE